MHEVYSKSLLELPTEILVEIFCNVDYLTLKVGLRLACRKFYDIIQYTTNGKLAAQLFRNNHIYLDLPNDGLVTHNNDDWEDEEEPTVRKRGGKTDRNWYYYELHPAISLLNMETGVKKYSRYLTMVDLGFPTRTGKFIPLTSTVASKESAMRLIGRYAADETVPASAFTVCYASNKQWAEDLTVEEFMVAVLSEIKDSDSYYSGTNNYISRQSEDGNELDFQSLLGCETKHSNRSRWKKTFYLYTPVKDTEDPLVIKYSRLFVRAGRQKDSNQ